MKFSKITATKSGNLLVTDPRKFYMILVGNNVHLLPIDSDTEPFKYESIHDMLEEWINITKF